MSSLDLEKRAAQAERGHRWLEAGELFLQLAHEQKDNKEFDRAANFFMRAAISFEREEAWRKIGHIWMQCAAAVECRNQGAVTDAYDFLEASKHFFPTLDLHAWERFSTNEKLGRAFRNAAYHLEKAGANQSAFTQYRRAGDAFKAGDLLDEASRSYYLALISYIERHGELDSEILEMFEIVNRRLTLEDETRYIRRIRVYYRRLASALNENGNYPAASQVFCKEADIARRLSLRNRNIAEWIGYTFWKWSSLYGNSILLWSGWAFALFFLLFPAIFSNPSVAIWKDAGRAPILADYVYFSIATVTTAPDVSFDLTAIGKSVSIAEGLLGFFMLGSLLSIVVKRFAR